MTWFKVDDTAHSHPKLLRAGNAALGLWLRAGAYAAQHLTEGVVPGVVAQLYGTAPQARKLVAAGLWHEHGHACGRCVQPAAGDYVMHDYLQYNPTRTKVEAKRGAAAERQARAREKAAAEREAAEKRRESKKNRPRIEDESSGENLESAPDQGAFWDEPAGQGGPSHRDAPDPSRSPRPDPTRIPPTEVSPPTPKDLTGRMVTAWWAKWGATTAQGQTAVRRAVAEALRNGIDPHALWSALDSLGHSGKPVTGGTLQFALSEIRRQPTAGGNVVPLHPSRTTPAASHTDNLLAGLRLLAEQEQEGTA